ncbi:MAG: tRNA threonylcarbamoyladenosine dehydratase, partial [Flavobacteriales bacterium]
LYVRKRLHRFGIYKGLQVVWSAEKADKSRIVLADSGPKKSVIGTISYMPAVFGITLASVVIRDLYDRKK